MHLARCELRAGVSELADPLQTRDSRRRGWRYPAARQVEARCHLLSGPIGSWCARAQLAQQNPVISSNGFCTTSNGYINLFTHHNARRQLDEDGNCAFVFCVIFATAGRFHPSLLASSRNQVVRLCEQVESDLSMDLDTVKMPSSLFIGPTW